MPHKLTHKCHICLYGNATYIYTYRGYVLYACARCGCAVVAKAVYCMDVGFLTDAYRFIAGTLSYVIYNK